MPSKVPEFQAVLLAASGSKLYPLTKQIPKALLPVANKPMIYYPLRWLEQAKVSEIMIVMDDLPSSQDILDYITKVHEWAEEAHPIITTYQVPLGSGSADAIRMLKGRITTDFIVATCDLITEAPPQFLQDSHRLSNPSMTALFYDCTKILATTDKISSKDDPSAEYIGIESDTSRLLLSESEIDLDDDELSINISLLQKFPKLKIHTQLRDAHVYIFKKGIVDLLVKLKDISSVRADLVPLLLEYQYFDSKTPQKGSSYRINQEQTLATKEAFDKFLDGCFESNKTCLSPTDHRETTPLGLLSLSQALSDVSELTCQGKKPKEVVCNAVIIKEELSTRITNRWLYTEINSKMIKSLATKVATSAEINQRTQVGTDCIVGSGSKIDERCSVKKSIIGQHCTIGKNCKISNSVIMGHVVIEDMVVLHGCIVCHNSTIHEKSNLKDVVVSTGYRVEANSVIKNEVLEDYHDD